MADDARDAAREQHRTIEMRAAAAGPEEQAGRGMTADSERLLWLEIYLTLTVADYGLMGSVRGAARKGRPYRDR